jgi:hypothetical protein
MKAKPPPLPSFPHVSTPPDRAVWWLVQTVTDRKPHLVLSQSAFGAAAARKLSMVECLRLERAPEVRRGHPEDVFRTPTSFINGPALS